MEEIENSEAKAISLTDFERAPEDDDSSILLANTNKLLSAVGLSAKKIVSTDELSRVSSSLFVAVFESLFNVRIQGIVRNPQSQEDYEKNAQLVIDGLSDQIQVDLKHITGKSIVSGDIGVLSNLVHILVQIVYLTGQESLTSYDSSEFKKDIEDAQAITGGGGGIGKFDTRFGSTHPSSDSISTLASAFEEENHATQPLPYREQTTIALPNRQRAKPHRDQTTKAGAKHQPSRPSKLRTTSSEPVRAWAKPVGHTTTNRITAGAGNIGGRSRRKPMSAQTKLRNDINSGQQVELFNHELRGTLAKAEKQVRLQKSMDDARKRRENELFVRETRSRANNLRHSQISREALQRRWTSDMLRERKASIMRQSSEEHVMLRKIYRGLLKKVLKWRIEEEQEVKAKNAQIKEETNWHLASLQSLFEERVAALAREEFLAEKSNVKRTRDEMAIADDLIKSISGRQAIFLAQQQSNLQQRKSRELLRRREAHKDLLAMLSTEDWQEMLREGYSAGDSRAIADSSRSAPTINSAQNNGSKGSSSVSMSNNRSSKDSNESRNLHYPTAFVSKTK